MARRLASIQWLDRFKGYSDVANPDDNPKITSDLSNVRFLFGRISGRGGMSKYQSVSTAASASILDLAWFRRVSGTHTLVRLMTTKVEAYSSGWTDITGTAMNGTATTLPQWDVIDDVLVFTNEGHDRPRQYTGTGNTSNIASSAAPYCKGLKAYLGFLFAFNVSDNGTFTDVVDGYRIGRYSDDWANSWVVCEGNEINLDETPGSWISAAVLGKSMFALKSDGVVKVRWTGGNVRFQQDGVPSDVGILAPRSLAVAGDPGSIAFFLGNDLIIYQITEAGVLAVTYDTLSELLINTAGLNKLRYARGFISAQEDTYYLFYDRTGLSNQLLDSYVSYNYRSKEVSKGTIGVSINAAQPFKAADYNAETLLLASPTLVETFNDTSINDDGVSINRYWTSNWQRMKDEGWLHAVHLIFKRTSGARVRVSCAFELEQDFTRHQVFSLAGASPSDGQVEVVWRPPSPQLVTWANIKIELIHDTTSASTRLERIGFEITPTALSVSAEPPRKSA